MWGGGGGGGLFNNIIVSTGDVHIAQFLSFLAAQRHVSVSTQKHALSALVFLYKNVLHRQKVNLPSWSHAKRPRRLPTVFSILEANLILDQLHGSPKLAALLMYGAGLRLMEVLPLRVKDIDFHRHEIMVRDGKGSKDRRTLLPNIPKGFQVATRRQVSAGP